MNVTALSNEDLVARVRTINAESNRLLAQLLVLLGEMDARKLYARHACPSMWEFCRRRLGMSEGATARRLDSARAVRKFPSLLGLIERGELHLTALSIVNGILTPENVESVIAEVVGKSKQEVLMIRARISPRPEARDMIRKLPQPPPVHLPATIAAPPPVAVTIQASATSSAVPDAGPTRPSIPLLAPPPVAVVPSVRIAPPVAPPIVPLRENGSKVQFMATDAIVAKIERAKDLMRHRNPKGDLATVFDAAMDLLLEKLEKEKFGTTSRPQKVERPSKQGHISQAARREVFARDGYQCTFCDAEGNRCPERGLLELDHIDPKGLGGSDEPENLRVRCRAHNLMHAADTFGAEFVERRIEESRERTARSAVRGARATATGGGNASRGP